MATRPPGKTTKKKTAAKKNDAPPAEPADSGETTTKRARSKAESYGYAKGAVISLTEKADSAKYRGKRLEYFNRLQKHNGKTVEKFFEACPADDPPRGWLRFFVRDGVCTLSGGE